MLQRLSFQIKDDDLRRLLAYCVMLLFVFTADGVMSYWAPTYIQSTLSSSLLMGLVLSFSSIVGLAMDFIFPQLLRGISLKTIIGFLLLTSLGFTASMFASTFFPLVLLFLLGMAVWGVYYELIIFADQQFVASAVDPHRRSMAWGIVAVFKSIAYVLGPIIAGWALNRSDRSVLFIAAGLTFVATILFMFMRFRDHQLKLAHHEINLIAELSHWRVLIKHIWPILLLSVSMGLVDATFWTTGTVWSEKLSTTQGFPGLFLSAYIFPSLFVGLILAKLNIWHHKKKIAMTFLFLSNIVLMGLGLSVTLWWQILVVLVASVLSGFAYPLVDAVYTDIVARMGRQRKHLIGLSGSTFSLAYIVGPVMAGFIAQVVGEQNTFVVVGAGAATVALALLLVTPKKLKVPQSEVRSWKE